MNIPILLALLAVAASTPLDGEGVAAHMAAIDDLLAMRQAGPLPVLTGEDYDQLAGGATVIKEQETGSGALRRVTVFRVADTAAWRIWLALSDGEHHEEFMPNISVSAHLGMDGPWRQHYQYMSLPAVKDRQWVIRARDNGALWNASGKRIWESHWTDEPRAAELIQRGLEDGKITGIGADDVEAAITTTSNEGYWLLVELPDDRTFIAYQSFSDLGGKVPSWIVNEIGPAGLKKLVTIVETRGRSIEQHFGADRPPPPAPDGSAVEQLK